MSTITKEQLRERAREKVKSLEFAVTQTAFANTRAELEEELELERIALASLEAEPVAYTEKCEITNMQATGLYLRGFPSNSHGRDIALFAAPPAPANAEPVAWLWSHRKYPSEVTLVRPEDDERAEGAHWSGWSCQALYSEPVTTAYKLPDGWVACSERMPEKNERVLIFINFNCDSVPPSIHDAQFTGSTFRRGGATVNVFPLEDGYGVTHWMPLPAAPQQEELL